MFSWDELITMGIRQNAYWLRQAEALKRQFIADVSHGVRIGMADQNDYIKAMNDLELDVPKDDLKKNRWEMMQMLGGGTGV